MHHFTASESWKRIATKLLIQEQDNVTFQEQGYF